MSKPVMLLDIDGVLNAVSKQAPTHVWQATDWNRTKIEADDGVEYPFLWSTPVIEWLTGLHDSGRIEIRWHTTWQHEALKVGQVLGLPEFAVQDCPEWEQVCANGSALAADLVRQCMPPWWKYPAAERIVAEEKRKLIWIDDDIDYEISRRTRAALRAVYSLELISPNQGTGIITKHMALVEGTLTRWEEARGAVSGS